MFEGINGMWNAAVMLSLLGIIGLNLLGFVVGSAVHNESAHGNRRLQWAATPLTGSLGWCWAHCQLLQPRGMHAECLWGGMQGVSWLWVPCLPSFGHMLAIGRALPAASGPSWWAEQVVLAWRAAPASSVLSLPAWASSPAWHCGCGVN